MNRCLFHTWGRWTDSYIIRQTWGKNADEEAAIVTRRG